MASMAGVVMHISRSPFFLLAIASSLCACSSFDSVWSVLAGEGGRSPGRVVAIPTPQAPDTLAAAKPQAKLATATTPAPASGNPSVAPVAAAVPPPAMPTGAGGIASLHLDAQRLQENVSRHNADLQKLRQALTQDVATYRRLVGAIEARLQMGVKPDDAELQGQWSEAQVALDRVDKGITQLATLSSDATGDSGLGGSILTAAPSVPGAPDADRQRLQSDVNASLAANQQLLAGIAADSNRQGIYLAHEREEIAALAVAIRDGELYGDRRGDGSLSAAPGADSPVKKAAFSGTSGRHPLVTIRFDRPNVPYQQALYSAVNRALEKRPDASFDLVAVSPSAGTPDQTAANATATKRNAESVLRSLAGMGLPSNRVSLSATTSGTVETNEVQLYIR